MKLAMQEALSTQNEVPVGAVIVAGDKVVSCSHNLTICNLDPTAHAEIVAMRDACRALKTIVLSECDMYVTLEPCAMCAQAISLSRIRRLYFGAYNKKYGGIENGARVFQHCMHVPETYGGFLEKENAKILQDFFQKLR